MNTKKRKIALTVLILFFVVLILFIIATRMRESDETPKCVRVQTSCCSCNMGGSERCVLESERELYEVNKSECPEPQICAAVYNCNISSCSFEDGECVSK